MANVRRNVCACLRARGEPRYVANIALCVRVCRGGTSGRSRSCGRPRHSNIQSLNECSIEKVASTLGFVFSSGELTLKGGWVGRGAPREIGAKAGKARPETKEGCGGQRAAPRQALAVSAQSEAETTLWPFAARKSFARRAPRASAVHHRKSPLSL